MYVIENIKTGKKYNVSDEGYKRIMRNKSLRSRFVLRQTIPDVPEVPEEIAKAINEVHPPLEVVSEVVVEAPSSDPLEDVEVEKPKRSRKKKDDAEETN